MAAANVGSSGHTKASLSASKALYSVLVMLIVACILFALPHSFVEAFIGRTSGEIPGSSFRRPLEGSSRCAELAASFAKGGLLHLPKFRRGHQTERWAHAAEGEERPDDGSEGERRAREREGENDTWETSQGGDEGPLPSIRGGQDFASSSSFFPAPSLDPAALYPPTSLAQDAALPFPSPPPGAHGAHAHVLQRVLAWRRSGPLSEALGGIPEESLGIRLLVAGGVVPVYGIYETRGREEERDLLYVKCARALGEQDVSEGMVASQAALLVDRAAFVAMDAVVPGLAPRVLVDAVEADGIMVLEGTPGFRSAAVVAEEETRTTMPRLVGGTLGKLHALSLMHGEGLTPGGPQPWAAEGIRGKWRERLLDPAVKTLQGLEGRMTDSHLGKVLRAGWKREGGGGGGEGVWWAVDRLAGTLEQDRGALVVGDVGMSNVWVRTGGEGEGEGGGAGKVQVWSGGEACGDRRAWTWAAVGARGGRREGGREGGRTGRVMEETVVRAAWACLRDYAAFASPRAAWMEVYDEEKGRRASSIGDGGGRERRNSLWRGKGEAVDETERGGKDGEGKEVQDGRQAGSPWDLREGGISRHNFRRGGGQSRGPSLGVAGNNLQHVLEVMRGAMISGDSLPALDPATTEATEAEQDVYMREVVLPDPSCKSRRKDPVLYEREGGRAWREVGWEVRREEGEVREEEDVQDRLMRTDGEGKGLARKEGKGGEVEGQDGLMWMAAAGLAAAGTASATARLGEDGPQGPKEGGREGGQDAFGHLPPRGSGMGLVGGPAGVALRSEREMERDRAWEAGRGDGRDPGQKEEEGWGDGEKAAEESAWYAHESGLDDLATEAAAEAALEARALWKAPAQGRVGEGMADAPFVDREPGRSSASTVPQLETEQSSTPRPQSRLVEAGVDEDVGKLRQVLADTWPIFFQELGGDGNGGGGGGLVMGRGWRNGGDGESEGRLHRDGFRRAGGGRKKGDKRGCGQRGGVQGIRCLHRAYLHAVSDRGILRITLRTISFGAATHQLD
ncbi:hypothetical protein NSK_000694 [Nannochloropsis salina CCMP1776]|uniref:Uncharacterized protein n=1 Tax=Nannochloropsis salina CCMP1776 TaxID=1027361 RepID=A0A4D9DFC9_9STRA|nr:hypothetical protein NSK_000694 [Nannochloropsis salina CCMP1776]|eukprot:TFJ88345.1 hypothetical protein NSK_000694 [Nannochloropsis salina CCMP1776]